MKLSMSKGGVTLGEGAYTQPQSLCRFQRVIGRLVGWQEKAAFNQIAKIPWKTFC